VIANILTIAGTDPTSGAGIQADLKTFSALGTYGLTVITALVAQNTQGVRSIHDVPQRFIGEQLDAVFDDVEVHAVKIGMLSRPEVIETVAERLEQYRAERIVVDPVMVAKSGDRLLREDAVNALRRRLLPMATLITPNLPEAGVLLDVEPAGDEPGMMQMAKALRELGPRAALVKGGHLEGEESIDILDDGEGEPQVLVAPRIATRNTHGTGCTLSSAIAAFLARGHRLPDAVREAKAYLTEALRTSDQLGVGHGHGPVHHFHALWSNVGNKR
jgi:hydroxymethylpyrimidine/phosphomethylpyrimidine kinase